MDEPYTLIGTAEAQHILETHKPGDYPDRCPECDYTRWPCDVADLAATVIDLSAEVAELRAAVRAAYPDIASLSTIAASNWVRLPVVKRALVEEGEICSVCHHTLAKHRVTPLGNAYCDAIGSPCYCAGFRQRALEE